MANFPNQYWGLILGGSSGFGLATAKKLAAHGMNLCIVHRDRRGAMKRIQPEFDALAKSGVRVVTCNANVLTEEGMSSVLDTLAAAMQKGDQVRMLLHSIAFGNLKLMAPQPAAEAANHQKMLVELAAAVGCSPDSLQQAVDGMFDQGHSQLAGVATPPQYDSEALIKDEDFALTVFSMGTSMASWTQAVFSRKLFAEDARVFGMTSEGNEVAWRGYGAVAAAKVALESVSRAIAREYAPYGIRSNIIQAGVTDTPALRLIPGSAHLKAVARNKNPYGRLTTPEDVADFIYLMCQDEAAWANGNVIRVDGGEHISG